MNQDQVLAMFQRLSADRDFTQWVNEQEAKALDALVEQIDPPQLHRSQGKIAFLRMMKQLLSHVSVRR